MLSVESCLGPLTYLRIWHDNSGKGKNKGWYLDQVQITDLQTGDRWAGVGLLHSQGVMASQSELDGASQTKLTLLSNAEGMLFCFALACLLTVGQRIMCNL